MNRRRFIGPVGTLTRVIVGGGLVALVISGPEWWGGEGLSWADAVLGLAAFPAGLVLAQWLRTLFVRARLGATDHFAFCLNIAVAGALFAFGPTRDAAALFYGASMLLAAARGYAGCEILAISNWLLRRDDQVGCLIFSPIDAIESKIAGAEPVLPGDEIAQS